MFKNLSNKLKYRKLIKLINEDERYGKHNSIYEIVLTKQNEPVLTKHPSDLSDKFLRIYLISYVKGIRHKAHMNIIFEENLMFIADIAVIEKNALNRGYGSVLMNKALEIAKTKGISYVTGEMSFSTPDQKERQIKYYSKYGFQIDDKFNLKLIL